jgi:probable phosphoglycerate mutase
LILVRHGETDWNVERRSQGWNDQPLNERGLHQARLAGAAVRQRFKPLKVWSSDLQRCLQTAMEVNTPVQRAPALRELRFGKWEGRLWPELHVEAPELAAKFVAGDPAFQAPGGEPISGLIRRAEGFIKDSAILTNKCDTVVVGHGGSLKALLVVLLGLPDTAYGRFHLSNASLSVVEHSGRSGRLHSLNDTSHLADVPPFI